MDAVMIDAYLFVICLYVEVLIDCVSFYYVWSQRLLIG